MIGKDKTGKYHPPKGKPSGSRKKGNENLTQYDIINESSVNEGVLDNARIIHVNRDVSKSSEEKSKKKS